MNFKKAVKKKLVKKLRSRRTVPDGRDSDAARSRSAGRAHTSRAAGTSHRQAVGGFISTEKRNYERKDPRIVAALRQIQSSNRCKDRTAAIACVRRGYARKQADKYIITSDGREYLRSGRGFD